MAVDPYSDRPIYQQVADELRAQIKRGELGPGQKLPFERDLSERYGTARLTARRALQVLVADGLVQPQRGVGVFVRAAGPIRRVTPERFLPRYRKAGMAALALEAEQRNDAWRRELLSLGEVPAPVVVAVRLGLDESAPVFARRRPDHPTRQRLRRRIRHAREQRHPADPLPASRTPARSP
ncbi:MAG: GntR family transcriptional regulator [Egibacteraceae bacterium]